MKSAFRPISVLALLLVGALAARAQITITVVGTAITGTGGYTQSSAYDFSFTINGSFATTVTSTFDGTTNSWVEEEITDNQLFTSITGGGLLGSFVRPVDPFSYLQVKDSSPPLSIFAAADSSNDIGVTSLDATPIRFIETVVTTGVTFANFAGYETPESYFAVSNNYLGLFSGAVGTVTLWDFNHDTIETFTITGLTISAIPEPSTYAALLGVAGLGLAAWRRRVARAA